MLTPSTSQSRRRSWRAASRSARSSRGARCSLATALSHKHIYLSKHHFKQLHSELTSFEPATLIKMHLYRRPVTRRRRKSSSRSTFQTPAERSTACSRALLRCAFVCCYTVRRCVRSLYTCEPKPRPPPLACRAAPEAAAKKQKLSAEANVRLLDLAGKVTQVCTDRARLSSNPLSVLRSRRV